MAKPALAPLAATAIAFLGLLGSWLCCERILLVVCRCVARGISDNECFCCVDFLSPVCENDPSHCRKNSARLYLRQPYANSLDGLAKEPASCTSRDPVIHGQSIFHRYLHKTEATKEAQRTLKNLSKPPFRPFAPSLHVRVICTRGGRPQLRFPVEDQLVGTPWRLHRCFLDLRVRVFWCTQNSGLRVFRSGT